MGIFKNGRFNRIINQISLAILLSNLCLLYILIPQASADYFSAKQAYQNRQYSTALTQFKQVKASSSKYALAQFYLGLIYAKQDQYQNARNAFQQTINLEQTQKLQSGGTDYNAALVKKAEKNLAVVTKAELESRGETGKAQALGKYYGSSKGNYLAHAMSNGSKVIRWDLAKMPLKVFIASGSGVKGWNTSKNQAVYNAMRTWKAASGNKLRFQQVHDVNHADIVVRWQSVFKHNKLGVSPLRTVGETILQSDVHLATYAAGSAKPLSTKELNWTALHEFGHALGIRGHSPYTDDAMFFSTNYSQAAGLTARDRNTIKLLYRQKADVSNNTQVSTSKNKQIYQLLEKARPLVHKQPQTAMNYVNQAYKLDPTNKDVLQMRNGLTFNQGVDYINNGVTYAKKNRLSDARSAFRRAEKIFLALNRKPNPPEGTQKNLSVVRQNLALLNN